MRTPTGLRNDNPAFPLIQDLISYDGITSGAGAADGTTLVCANLANEPSYLGHKIKIKSGNAAGQTRYIVNDTSVAGIAVVNSPFTDNAGAPVLITASTLFSIISEFKDEALHYGTTTAAGAVDGSTLVDTGLATPFTVDDEPIGHSIRILTSSDATLVGQEREVYDYDFGTTTLVANPRFTAQVPINTTYIILRNRPSAGGGPIPPPEPEAEETTWRLADYDNFDVADATADTERWSSEYQVGVPPDGTADINTTTPSALHVDITAAAPLAVAQYGVRRLWRNVVRKFLTLTDVSVTVTNPNVNHVWAGLAISRGIAWDANNYIAIYKRQNNVPVEGIAVEYRLAGAAAVITAILATTQDAVAFKIERENTMWRCYYSLTQAPHHNWILALEIEDPTNSLTDTTSTYLTAYNPEDAVGQQIAADFHRWEYYETLGNLGDILNIINIISQMGRPEIQYYEGWQDELGIDFTLWNVTHPVGAPWTRGAGTGVMADGLRATCVLNANEIARLVTTFRDPIGPDTWGINSILRLTHFEFEMTIANLLNLDNTQCFFGLTPNQADTRVAQNIIGFALIGAGNALQTVTDLLGAETVNTGFLENLANKNKFRITIRQTAAGVGTIDFYLNEALIATHITNLPDLPMYKNWYLDTNGGGGGAVVPQIGINRLWTEDFQRP